MKINLNIILRVIGAIIFFVGLIMLAPSVFSLVQEESKCWYLLFMALCTLIFGVFIFRFTNNGAENLSKRDGYLIVVGAWVITALFSALPYIVNNYEVSFVDAWFESVSGLTTTGATIFKDLEELPSSILLWRSLTQWIGGMGIIVLTIAIFPLLGVGGVELFVAESPGPTSNKIHPRIKETAKRLWLLYVSLTTILIGILYLEGMSFFNALNHGLTTIATGGFSTKNESMAYFDSPLIQYTIIIFMFIAGINYSLIYASLRGQFKRVYQSDEFKVYVLFVLFSIAIVTCFMYSNNEGSFEVSFRTAAFQVISMITTTGFVIEDFTVIHPVLSLFFFCLLFSGACAGSTSGGIKFVRHLVFAKNSLLEFKRLLHPNAMIRLRLDKRLIAPKILTHVLVFLLVYLFVFVVGTIAMTFVLADFEDPLISAAGMVATCLGNVGPSIGSIGPLDNFSSIPATGKYLLTFIMLIGRLELFSVLILFTPYFWRSH